MAVDTRRQPRIPLDALCRLVSSVNEKAESEAWEVWGE